MSRADVVVIGGGLAGLAAAAYLGRAGRRVLVLEKAGALGGRAATLQKDGFSLNLGPHALYLGGAGAQVLGELGVHPVGGRPVVSGAHALAGGVLHTLPGGFLSLLTTGLFGLAAKIEAARVLSRLPHLDPAPLDRVPVATWLGRSISEPPVRRFLEALLRLSTYSGDMQRLSAGAALRQFQVAQQGVLYLDGGWQRLVDDLRGVVAAAGVEIRTGARAAAIELEGGAVRAVRLVDGGRLEADAAVVAASPAAARALVPDNPALAAAAARALPVHAACLDVALSALPRPKSVFALGVDRPLYASVHSAVARVAPAGGATLHLAKYQPSPEDPADEGELERLLDQLQPGFRDRVITRRFLPSLIVSHALVTAEGGGLSGRPDVAVPGARGLFLAGDWVGPEGMLADASLASARRAAKQIAARPADAPAVEPRRSAA